MTTIIIDSDEETNNRVGDDGVIDRSSVASEEESSSDGGRPVPHLDPAPRRRKPQNVIPSTPFASTYRSSFMLLPEAKKLLPSLAHVNCSYLSTPGLPPTLLQLKQHAQSLIVLIKALTVSTSAGVIDNANNDLDGVPSFTDGETYDFLNDLSKPYCGPVKEALRTHHNMPLTSTLNVVEDVNIPSIEDAPPELAIRNICPLHQAYNIPENGLALPYAAHRVLIAHANEVLELLDHEYSAKGGILGILPEESEKDDRARAESTLLGQMILYLQRLMMRMHDLERQYANSMDVIADEAVVPHQTLWKLGVEGRKERELVYPQDRFVLANAGENLWQFLNGEFEKKEKEDALAMENARATGVTGEALWEQNGPDERSRGLTALDITTRYYRLRGDPIKTVFIIPAHQEHPGVRVTRDMEKVPTVVSVVKPTWPERASTLEIKHRKEMEELKKLREETAQLRTESGWTEDEKKVLLHENEKLAAQARALKRKLRDQESVLKEPGNETKRKLNEKSQESFALQEELEGLIEEAKKDREAAKNEKTGRAEDRHDIDRLRNELVEEYRQREKKLREEHEKAMELTGKREEAVKEANRIKEYWKVQLTSAHIMADHLKDKNVSVGGEEVSQENIRVGTEHANALFRRVIGEGELPTVEGGSQELGQDHFMSGAL